MLKVYDDGSVYVGEMQSEQRNGRGVYYILSDLFAGYKVSGIWQNDKLNGIGKITTRTYTEEGMFDSGIKNGVFIRTYLDGRCSQYAYKSGVYASVEEYKQRREPQDKVFGQIKLSEELYYLGDICEGVPFGFGMVYGVDDKQRIKDMMFCEIVGGNIIQCIDINSSVYKSENANEKQ